MPFLFWHQEIKKPSSIKMQFSIRFCFRYSIGTLLSSSQLATDAVFVCRLAWSDTWSNQFLMLTSSLPRLALQLKLNQKLTYGFLKKSVSWVVGGKQERTCTLTSTKQVNFCRSYSVSVFTPFQNSDFCRSYTCKFSYLFV